jgi:hypothetical protein
MTAVTVRKEPTYVVEMSEATASRLIKALAWSIDFTSDDVVNEFYDVLVDAGVSGDDSIYNYDEATELFVLDK